MRGRNAAVHYLFSTSLQRVLGRAGSASRIWEH